MPRVISTFPSNVHWRTVWSPSSVSQTVSSGAMNTPCARGKTPSPNERRKLPSAVEHDHRMLTAIEDVDVVVRVHANAADFLKRPAGREFRPVLQRFVCVFTVAHGSHGQDSPALSLAELVTKRRLRPGTVLGKALAAKGVRLPSCGSSDWNRVSGIIDVENPRTMAA